MAVMILFTEAAGKELKGTLSAVSEEMAEKLVADRQAVRYDETAPGIRPGREPLFHQTW